MNQNNNTEHEFRQITDSLIYIKNNVRYRLSNTDFIFSIDDGVLSYSYGLNKNVYVMKLISRINFRKNMKNFNLSNENKDNLWKIITRMVKFHESLDDHVYILEDNKNFSLGVFHDGKVEISYHGDEVQDIHYLSDKTRLKSFCSKLDLSQENQKKVYNYISNRDNFSLIE